MWEEYFNHFIFGPMIKGSTVIIVTLIVLVIGKAAIRKYFNIVAQFRKNINKITTVKKVLLNIYKIIVLFVSITIFLNYVLGVDTSSILTVAGVSGVAVGFASQNIIKDMLSGILLLMEENLTIGDNISVNGYKGVVEDINMRSISIRDEQGVLHIIPNNVIRDFSNYSRK